MIQAEGFQLQIQLYITEGGLSATWYLWTHLSEKFRGMFSVHFGTNALTCCHYPYISRSSPGFAKLTSLSQHVHGKIETLLSLQPNWNHASSHIGLICFVNAPL